MIDTIIGVLICTLIFENQCLEKSKSISNPRKISGLQTLIFFSRSPIPCKKHSLYYKHEKNSGAKPEKKIKVCRTLNCSRAWNRPWFSVIRVQIKKLHVRTWLCHYCKDSNLYQQVCKLHSIQNRVEKEGCKKMLGWLQDYYKISLCAS